MNKTEIHDKNVEHVSKRHILLFIIGFFLLGAILELIFGYNADKVFPVVLIVIAIIHVYIKRFKMV